MEGREDACYDCFVAQGVLRHVRAITALHEAAERDRAAMRMARDEVLAAKEEILRGGPGSPRGRRSRARTTRRRTRPRRLSLPACSTACGRSWLGGGSRLAAGAPGCETLETGGERFLVDFLEELDELADAAEASSVETAAGWPAAAGRSWTAGSGRSRWPGT